MNEQERIEINQSEIAEKQVLANTKRLIITFACDLTSVSVARLTVRSLTHLEVQSCGRFFFLFFRAYWLFV